MKICSFLFAFFLMLMLSCYSPTAQINTTAYISTTWTTPNSYGPVPILLTETKVAKFACGFISRGQYIAYQFAIFISPTSEFPSNYEVVWSANRDHPVTTYITQNVTAAGELVVRDVILNFTAARDLVLKDGDGSIVWTTNTAGKSVAGMNLTHTGNLVLFDHRNSVVWQSFDHPTDSLLLGQMLYQDKKLKSSVSDTRYVFCSSHG
ncbi:putative bulb-type lectin domain-containing protein [Helianthus annuus]|nr:putative bulb-type lectin domain-containing protein [Helianthus annuus]KAJ0857008.1 putative bulb-type lectin domain-containing protein [Helianthus annuus]